MAFTLASRAAARGNSISWWERTGFIRGSASWFLDAESQFEKYLGFKAAAFGTRGYRPRDELVYVMYTQVGQQVARFAMRDDRTMFLFTFADEDPGSPGDIESQKALLRKRFEGSGWE